MTTRFFHRWQRTEDGVALVTAIIFLAVASALAATVTTVATSGIQNSNRDRQAGGAQATAEAGVAQGLQLLRAEPAGYFTCNEPAPGSAPSGACLTNPAGWTNSSSPEKVSSNGTVGTCVPTASCYQVWIGTVSPYSPSTGYATYRIHSTGLYGGGPAARSVAVDVTVRPDKFPIGVYADDASTGGTFGINRESLFTKGCLAHREFDSYDSTGTPNTTTSGGGIAFSGVDPQYDLPAAAHAAQFVTQANTTSCSSGTSSSKKQANVHDASQSWAPCNTLDLYDQDSQGGDLTGTACYDKWTSPVTGRKYPTTSKFTLNDLQTYGYRPGGLSDSQYKSLKAMAITTGTYFTSTSTSSLNAALTAANATTAVVYFDLTSGGGKVTLKPSDIPSSYFRSPTDSNCAANLHSIVFVVRGGDMVYNSSGNAPGPLVASIFVPDGNYSGQGGATIIGTLFAKSIDGTGTQNWYLDQCFVDNPPGPVMSVQVTNYREVDTRDVN